VQRFNNTCSLDRKAGGSGDDGRLVVVKRRVAGQLEDHHRHVDGGAGADTLCAVAPPGQKL